MMDVGQMLQQAAALAKSGQWAAAETAYRRIQAAEPANLQARSGLAGVLFHLGWHEKAIGELRAAIELAPGVGVLHRDLGTMLSGCNQPREAIAELELATRLAPDDAVAWFNLGNVHFQAGDFLAAASAYGQAASRSPADPDVFLNQGVALRMLGEFNAARTSLERAIELNPRSPDGWINLGALARAAGDDSEAERCYRCALEVDPACARAYNNLGSLAQSQFRSLEAIELFRRALDLQPNYSLAQTNLGDACLAVGRLDEARAIYADLVQRSANDAVEIKLALAINPLLGTHSEIDHRRQEFNAGLARLRARALAVTEPVESVGLPAFYLAYQGRDECATQRQISEVLRRATPSLSFVAPHCNRLQSVEGRRLKIGFISRYFYDHTIAKLNRGVVAKLDRKRFHVELLRFAGREDAITQAMATSADSVQKLSPKLAVARQQISERELDLLYFTDIGMDALTYYLAHARLAPVQCATWGHPLTTGISTIDYFISSEDLETAGSESQYTETLIRLPHLATYYARPGAVPAASREAWGFDHRDHLYACPQSLFKLHPDDDLVFGRILREDPRARILLLEGQQAAWTTAVRERLRLALGPLADRIHLLPRMSTERFQQLLGAVDALLDPLHFGGGNTSYEALAAGTPVVTRPGGLLRNRITYAMYRAMEFEETVACDVEAYVSIAVRLSTDESWRDHVRGEIRARSDRLFEDARGVRALEDFLARLPSQ